MGRNSQYISENKEYAIQQMQRYGIPASVTLAQGILESANGRSQLCRESNNHFGIKATSSWLKNGGQYVLADDDKPNEKFCKYNSAAESFEHHSKFLANGTRYKACFNLSPDDYKGWTEGIARAAYATGGGYAKSLQKIIEANGLNEIDKQVMASLSPSLSNGRGGIPPTRSDSRH